MENSSINWTGHLLGAVCAFSAPFSRRAASKSCNSRGGVTHIDEPHTLTALLS